MSNENEIVWYSEKYYDSCGNCRACLVEGNVIEETRFGIRVRSLMSRRESIVDAVYPTREKAEQAVHYFGFFGG